MNISILTFIHYLHLNYLFVPFYIFVALFYLLWSVYLAKEIRYLKKKLWRISQDPSSYENDVLYMKYNAEYYKHIIMLSIIVVEPLSLFPSVIDMSLQSFIYDNPSSGEGMKVFILMLCQVVCFSLANLPFLVTVFLLDLLTNFQINLYSNIININLIKQKLKFILILSSILFILALSVVGTNISQLIAVLFISYYVRILKRKSENFSDMLRLRYNNSLLYSDNIPLQRYEKRVALRYKYFNTLMLSGFIVLTASFWLLFFVCLFYPITSQWFSSKLGIEAAIKTIHLSPIIELSRITVLLMNILALTILTPTFVGFSIVYLAKNSGRFRN